MIYIYIDPKEAIADFGLAGRSLDSVHPNFKEDSHLAAAEDLEATVWQNIVWARQKLAPVSASNNKTPIVLFNTRGYEFPIRALLVSAAHHEDTLEDVVVLRAGEASKVTKDENTLNLDNPAVLPTQLWQL